ncbi:MAG TPA: hypothetical protein VGK58_07620 [Lacipirellulaceae bacterium]
MSDKPRLIVDHSFRGGRFEDHGVAVDALKEVIVYKEMVTEVAKDLWRSRHPDRERLPAHFEDAFSLKIYRIVPNCVTIPLEREAPTDAQQSLFLEFEPTDELTLSVELIARTIEAASNDMPLPTTFPKRLLPLFQQYGTSLRPDERIEQLPYGWTHHVTFDNAVRERIVRVIDSNYTATVDLIGQVTMARVNKPRMGLELEAGGEVEAVFLPEHEDAIVTALKNHETAKVRVRGTGQYSGTGELQRIVEVDQVILLPEGLITINSSAMPIWARFQEIASSLPANAFDHVPSDGASRHDFYLYGNVASQQ